MATNPITSDDLTIDFQSLLAIPISDRVQAAALDTGFSQALIASLTPIQMAKAFPDYYRKELPDISNFILANRYLDKVGAGGFDQRGGGDYGRTPGSMYGGETAVPADKTPFGTPEPTIEEMKKSLLEKGIDADNIYNSVGAEGLPENDPKIAVLKDQSAEKLSSMGFERVEKEDGTTIIRQKPLDSATMTDEQAVSTYKKRFVEGAISPRERATLDFIAKREGSKDPNIIFGGERYKAALGLDKKPLTERTISEVFQIQDKLRELTKADGYGVNNRGEVVGTSAVGTGQMIEGTLRNNLKALGIKEEDFDKIKFDKNLQDRLTLMNFKTSGIGDPNADPSTWNHAQLGNQYESLNPNRGHALMNDSEIESIRTASSVRPESTANVTPIEARKKLDEAQIADRKNSIIRETYNKPSPTSTSTYDKSGRIASEDILPQPVAIDDDVMRGKKPFIAGNDFAVPIYTNGSEGKEFDEELAKLTPQAIQRLKQQAIAAKAAGLTKLELYGAQTHEGHASHGAGTETDVVGYNEDGSMWNRDQRATTALGAVKMGNANRVGLYGSGRGLHTGMAGESPNGPQVPGAWGPGGKTSGVSVDEFTPGLEQDLAAYLKGQGPMPESKPLNEHMEKMNAYIEAQRKAAEEVAAEPQKTAAVETPAPKFRTGGSPETQDDENLSVYDEDGNIRWKMNSGEGVYVKPEANEYADTKMEELSGRVDEIDERMSNQPKQTDNRPTPNKPEKNWQQHVANMTYAPGSQGRAFKRTKFQNEGFHWGRGSPNSSLS